MRLCEGRILKLVMLEALELRRKGREVGEGSAFEFGDLWMERFECGGPERTVSEGGKALGEGYCREEVREGWREEARGRSKLEVIRMLMDGECKLRCVEIVCKRQRRMLVKLKDGMAELRIDTGRWCGLSRDVWICMNCDEGEVKDIEHFMLRCVCGWGEDGDGEVDE